MASQRGRLSSDLILLPQVYGRCTDGVRALWVLSGERARQTGGMASGPTAFVTGADGFLGTELVRLLVAGGHQVVGLVESIEAVARLRHAGAVAVIGDLRRDGPWQDEAAADWVFHLPPSPAGGQGFDRLRAAFTARRAATIDTPARRGGIGTNTAARVRRHHECLWTGRCALHHGGRTTEASTWGRCLAPALDGVEAYSRPACPSSRRFRLRLRQRIVVPRTRDRSGSRRSSCVQVGKTGPWVSPIHVHDCARALMHLAGHGAVGGRYFLVNRDPVQMHEFAEAVARLANRRLRVRRLPAALARLVTDPIPRDCVRSDVVFSNIRLRGIGFQFRYSTIDAGIEQILGAIDGHPRTTDPGQF